MNILLNLWIKAMYGILSVVAVILKLFGGRSQHPQNSEPLIDAVRQQDITTVRTLLDHGANPNTLAPLEFLELRPGYHSLFTRKEPHWNDSQKTALMIAAFRGKTHIMQLLLDRGADINLVNQSGWSALDAAITGDQTEALQFLLSRGADVNITGFYGDTPLMLAISSGKEEMVRILLDNGADLNAKNEAGDTALMDSVRIGHRSLVAVLVAAGAEVNARDIDGHTALWWARHDRKHEIAEWLLSVGAVE